MRIRLRIPTPNLPKRTLWMLACGLVAVSLLVNELVGQNGYWARQGRRRQMHALVEEIEKLQQDNQRLGQRIQELRSDPNAIEKQAREQLRLGRPGEVVVTLPQPAPSPSAPSSQ